MMISRKLPRRSQRRGLTSFQTSGMTFFSFGLGRFAVRSAAAALPTLREGRSAAFIPPPNLDGPKEEDILCIPILRRGPGGSLHWMGTPCDAMRLRPPNTANWMMLEGAAMQYQDAFLLQVKRAGCGGR